MQYWQRRRKRNEKDRQKLRMHLVCQAKCKYTCVIRFKDGKMGNQNARRLDAVQTEITGLYCAFLSHQLRKEELQMKKLNENDILETTLSIAEKGYPEAYQFLLNAYEESPTG